MHQIPDKPLEAGFELHTSKTSTIPIDEAVLFASVKDNDFYALIELFDLV